MPSDDVLWASIVLTALAIGIGYFVRRWALSVSFRLGGLSDSAAVLESRLTEVRSDVGGLTRSLTDKLGVVEADSMLAAFALAPLRRVRRKTVVSVRG